MPIENEYKFPLNDPDGTLERTMETHPDFQKITIRQGYLRKGCRVREWNEGPNGKHRFIFSYKHRVEDDVVEIETDIEEDDFNRLWTVAEKPVEKIRFKKVEGTIIWDVDFLKHNGVTYFALAEVELPAEDREVPSVPDILKNHAMGRMERHCKALTNKRLSDPDYAARVMDAFIKHKPLPPAEDIILKADLINI